MQQNLNPKGKKNHSKAMQEISRMVSRLRHLGASGCLLFFCLRTARPLLKPRFETFVDRCNRLEHPEMAFSNFLKKTAKAVDNKLADGKEWM